MSNEIMDRTPLIIAAEINSIKGQSRKIILYSAIEIGRRLTEAKSLVAHGEWGKWLENSVSYSQSTANKLMRIYEEYGSKQLDAIDGNSNSDLITNLSYTQALILLGVPENEREEFISAHDMDSMSTQELRQAVQERDQALSEKADLQKALDTQKGTITQITVERDNLRKQAVNLTMTIRANEATVRTLRQELAAAKKDGATADKLDALQKELTAAQSRVSANKVAVHFDNMVKVFDELLKELTSIATTDTETHEKYKSAVNQFVEKIAERM